MFAKLLKHEMKATAGSIGLYCPEKRLLYVGDAMNCFVWLFLPEAQSLDTYINTLHKAAKLPFTHMIQSHEPCPVPRRKLWDYLDLAEHLIAYVLEIAVQNGIDSSEAYALERVCSLGLTAVPFHISVQFGLDDDLIVICKHLLCHNIEC